MIGTELIGLRDLPDGFRVGLEDKFRTVLFGKAIEKIGKTIRLAKELRCNTNTISNLKKGKSFIKIFHLRKLSEINSSSLDEIEKHVIELKTRNRKRRIKIKFPIIASPELASVIGHCTGDGSLSERQFSFFNQSRELVDEVIVNLNAAFSTNVAPKEFKKSGGWEIEFPTNIARLIALTGGPIGKKVLVPFRVPEWVTNGSKEIKIAFIRALFDDEGWVKIKFIRQSSSTQRMIGINMSKCVKLLDNHRKFLEDIRTMLLELGIKSSKVVEMGKTVNGTNLGFIISNLENIKKFLVIIGFIHLTKQKQLIECLKKSKKFNQLFPNFIQTFKG